MAPTKTPINSRRVRMSEHNSPSTPTAPDWRAAIDRLGGAYAPSTLKSYRADIAVFDDWCRAHGLAPFPATIETVCEFLEDQGRVRHASTVCRRLYAVRKMHRLLRMPDPTHDEEVNLSLRRVRRAGYSRPVQAKALTRDYLDRFIAAQPDTPWGLRNGAMLSLGYELLTRRSELIALRTEDIEIREDGTLQLIVRRSKSDQFGAGRLAFTSRATAERIEKWLAWRGPHITPLFCPIYQSTPIDRDLSTTTVKRVIKGGAERAG